MCFTRDLHAGKGSSIFYSVKRCSRFIFLPEDEYPSLSQMLSGICLNSPLRVHEDRRLGTGRSSPSFSVKPPASSREKAGNA